MHPEKMILDLLQQLRDELRRARTELGQRTDTARNDADRRLALLERTVLELATRQAALLGRIEVMEQRVE